MRDKDDVEKEDVSVCTSYPKCPHCGKIETDSMETTQEGDYICSNCEGEFSLEIEITYYSYPK